MKTNSESSSLLSRLQDALRSSEIQHEIAKAISSEQLLSEIASRSYHHPNGFSKIVLREYPDGIKLRLHVWDYPDLLYSRFSNVHNHRWDFASHIVTGIIVNEVHNVSTGVTHNLFRFTPGKPGGEYGFELVGSVDDEIDSISTLTTGMSYFLEAQQFHRVAITGKAITVVMSGLPVKNTTDVVRSPELPAEDQMLHLLDSSELLLELEMAREAISAQFH